MSKYQLPNGLQLVVDNETGDVTPVAGTGNQGPAARAVAAGRGAAPLSDSASDEDLGIASPLAVPKGRTLPSATGGGAQPLSELRPPPEQGLTHEDPIGDVIVGDALAAPVGAAVSGVGRAVGAAVKPFAKAAGTVVPAVRAVTKEALESPAAMLEAVKHPLAHVASKALELSHPVTRAAQLTIDEHLAKLAGETGEAGAAALKAIALRPSRETLAAAVRIGIAPRIALQVARLGAQNALGGK